MRTELIDQRSQLFDFIVNQDTIPIGEMFHKALLLAAANGGFVGQTFYTLTPTKLFADVMDGETSEVRQKQARQYGRDSSEEFGNQPLFYLVQQSMCWETSDKTLRPSEDPNRKESCYTFVAPLLPLCMSKDLAGHMKALQKWDIRVWSHTLHEGLPIKIQHDGAMVVTSINKESGNYDQTETNIAILDNNLMSSCMVGFSKSFPAIQSVRRETPLQQAIALELMKKNADKIQEEAFPTNETIKSD